MRSVGLDRSHGCARTAGGPWSQWQGEGTARCGGAGVLCPRAALRDPQPHELGQVPRHCDSFVSSSADEGFGVNLPSLHLQHDIRRRDAGYRRETGSQETWRQSEFTCRL